jgi:quinol monooxygenase YgiN
MKRREFLQKTGFAALYFSAATQIITATESKNMHGIIGKIITIEGKRDDLIAILLAGTKDMPGCISYIISKDSEDANGIWISEVWKDEESHQNSMTLASVQEAIMKGKPLIAGFDQRHIVEPIGGQGI